MTGANSTMATGAETFWLALEQATWAVHWPEVDGVRTRVLDAGPRSDTALVLLHGTAGHLEAFAYNIAALSREQRVVAYDLPGHGWSAAPERSYEVNGYIAHLQALLDACRIERATLVGQSLGGWVAAAFAARHPDRVARIALVGPGGTIADPAVMERLRRSSLEAVMAPTFESVRRRLELIVADPGSVTEEIVACRLRIYAQGDAPERMRRVLCLQDPVVRARNMLTPEVLAAVPHPALVISGDQDAIVPLDASRRFAELLPAGTLAVMPGCGHWPQFEAAAEFNQRMSTFTRGA